jgi:F-box/leucine-rich repeat protein 2/20
MDARGVRKIIDGCPRLNDLRINECRGMVDKAIMNRLFETNHLERLFMHGCSDLRDEHLQVLFEGPNPDVCPLSGRATVPPRKLRHLDISKIYLLTHRGLKSMVGNVPELEGLQLGGNVELTDDALTDLLPTVPKLTHLDLEELSELTNETPKNIAQAPCHERLEHISFSYCEHINDTGMLPLIKACRRLRNLEMDNTRVSDLSLAEAADVVRSRSRRSTSQCQPEIGLRMVVYDCQHVTWTGIREVISRNAEVKRPYLAGVTAQQSYPTEVIQLKCFYGWQMTVDEHMKRVLKGDLASASRLERKWAEYMMATEEAGATGAGSRRRRRRAREAAMLHADEEEAGVGQAGIGRRRRARSGGCTVM